MELNIKTSRHISTKKQMRTQLCFTIFEKTSTKKQERTFHIYSCFAVFVFTCKAFSFANDKLFQRTYRFSISSAVNPVFSAMTSRGIPACLRFFAISRCFCAAPFLSPMASPSARPCSCDASQRLPLPVPELHFPVPEIRRSFRQ